MEILAHRANLAGPNHRTENTQPAVEVALLEGFGIETDLRRDSEGRLYISHDALECDATNDFQSFEVLFREWPARCVALNVKELGYEEALIELQHSGAFGGESFLFDFELLEPGSPGRSQRHIRSLPGGNAAVLASRLSDRSESLEQCLSIDAQVVWIDEFDSQWVTMREIDALRARGRRLYVVSPELHRFGEDVRLKRWHDFRAWGVDGICTDYALAARDFFAH